MSLILSVRSGTRKCFVSDTGAGGKEVGKHWSSPSSEGKAMDFESPGGLGTGEETREGADPSDAASDWG
jgi:hypothetical protein